MMQSSFFKNQPDRLTSLLFLIPGLVLSLFYLVTIHSGEFTGYMVVALLGAAGFGLGFVKILRPVRIWELFALGFGIGVICFVVATIGSPMMNLGIPALRSQPWPTVRALVAIGLCLLAIGLLGRWLDHSRGLFWKAAGVLLLCGLVWAILPAGPNENTLYLWDLSWTWGYVTAILGVGVLGVQLSRRLGALALLAVMVALGLLNAVHLSIADVAVGKTPFGQIMLLLAYLFPLVICPAWLLLAAGWRGKKYGVLLSWGVMWTGMVLVLPVVDTFLEPHYFRYVQLMVIPGSILNNVLTHTPAFIGLWLAFKLYENQYQQPQPDIADKGAS